MATRPKLATIREASAGAAMLEKLRRGTQNSRSCQWPGTEGDEGRFLLVPLNCDELQEAYAAAHARFDSSLKVPLNLYTADDFHSELNMQICYRAMRRPDDREARWFASPDELRKLLTPEERNAVTTEYLSLQQECDPDPEALGDELVTQIDELVKKKDAPRLAAMPSLTLALYVIGTADRSAS